MAGLAGYLGSVKVSGDSSAVVDQGMTLSSGKTYYSTSAANNIWDPTVAVTFEDNTVPVAAADIESVDYLMGKVTFASGYTVTGPVTFSGNVLELEDVAFCRGYSLQILNALLNCTVFGNTHVNMESALKDAGFTFEDLSQGLDDLDPGASTLRLYDLLTNGTPKVWQFGANLATDPTCWRIWGLLGEMGVQSAPDDLLGASLTGHGTLEGFLTSSASFGNPEA